MLHLINVIFLSFKDPFSEKRGRFQYKNILTRLQAIRAKLMVTLNAPPSIETSDAPTSEISSPSDTDLDEDSSNSGLNANDTTVESAASGTNGASKPVVDVAPTKSSELCEGTSVTLAEGREDFKTNIESQGKKSDDGDV